MNQGNLRFSDPYCSSFFGEGEVLVYQRSLVRSHSYETSPLSRYSWNQCCSYILNSIGHRFINIVGSPVADTVQLSSDATELSAKLQVSPVRVIWLSKKTMASSVRNVGFRSLSVHDLPERRSSCGSSSSVSDSASSCMDM